MPDLDELLAELDDDETRTAIKAKFQEQEQVMAKRQALLDRDAKVQKEQAKLAEKFPRAMVAFGKGRLHLPDDPSDEALVAALKDKEAELEELGVPVPGAAAPVAAKEETPEDPAAAWGRDVAPGGSGADALSLLEEAKAAFKADEYGSRADAIGIIQQMYAKGQPDLHAQLVESLHPKYPVGQGPGAIITNLQPTAGAGKKNTAPAKKGKTEKAKA